MKNKTLRKVALVALPALTVAGIGFTLAQPPPDLVLEKTVVVSLPPSNGKYYFNTEPDTQVSIFIKDNSWSLFRRFIKGPEWDLTATNHSLHLIDDRGNRYRSIIYVTDAQDQGHQRYRISTRFSLAQVPSRVSRLTVEATITADQGKPLPVSIVVPRRS